MSVCDTHTHLCTSSSRSIHGQSIKVQQVRLSHCWLRWRFLWHLVVQDHAWISPHVCVSVQMGLAASFGPGALSQGRAFLQQGD